MNRLQKKILAVFVIALVAIYLIVVQKNNQQETIFKEDIAVNKTELTNYKEIKILEKDNFTMELEYSVVETVKKDNLALFEIEIYEFDESSIIEFVKGYEYFVLEMNPQLEDIEVSLVLKDEIVAIYESKVDILKIKETTQEPK